MIDNLGLQQRGSQNIRRQATLHARIKDIAHRIHVRLEAGENNHDLFDGTICRLDQGRCSGLSITIAKRKIAPRS